MWVVGNIFCLGNFSQIAGYCAIVFTLSQSYVSPFYLQSMTLGIESSWGAETNSSWHWVRGRMHPGPVVIPGLTQKAKTLPQVQAGSSFLRLKW